MKKLVSDDMSFGDFFTNSCNQLAISFRCWVDDCRKVDSDYYLDVQRINTVVDLLWFWDLNYSCSFQGNLCFGDQTNGYRISFHFHQRWLLQFLSALSSFSSEAFCQFFNEVESRRW